MKPVKPISFAGQPRCMSTDQTDDGLQAGLSVTNAPNRPKKKISVNRLSSESLVVSCKVTKKSRR